ncbi:MAG: hypothetical protein GX882_04045, partial [Methanomicrobiales archaeon]|nr:hypothetical protein [Methanomicrobiales archaeon]
VIAFLIPAVAAADTYITITADDATEYRGLRIATIDALDPLETGTSPVTLEGDNLTVIPCPAFGTITRIFDPAGGTYRGAKVTATESKTIDGSTLPGDYRVFNNRAIPNFIVDVPGRAGNVLLIRSLESPEGDINFTTFFRAAKDLGYLFTGDAVLYSNETGISAYGSIDMRDYDGDDLNFTLARNEVDLSYFRTDGEMLQNMMDAWPYTRPDAGEYLLTAVHYDSASETLQILAAMPILILAGNPAVAWNGGDPYYQDRGAGAMVSFGESMDRTAYILLRNNATYDLVIRVDTEEFVNRPIPTSVTDLITLLQAATDEAGPVACTLTPGDTPAASNVDSNFAIARGYGLSGYADGSVVEIGAGALASLNPGTYSLYALGMRDGKIIAVGYREVEVRAAS